MKLRSKGNKLLSLSSQVWEPHSDAICHSRETTAELDLGFANSRSESALRPSILSECAKFASQGAALSTHRGPGVRFSLVLVSHLRLSVLVEDSPQPSPQHTVR